MPDLTHGRSIRVPRDVAVCPACDDTLVVIGHHVVCQFEVYIASKYGDESWRIERHQTTDWQPVLDAVAAWAKVRHE